jgi:HD-GYP domain-containing protein (c-di-GMP phosphodiesterase class II)
LSLERAIEELKAGAGTQFDPKFVEAFLGVWDTGALEPIFALGREGQGISFGRKELLEGQGAQVQA